mgnify:CR=1 FL=1
MASYSPFKIQVNPLEKIFREPADGRSGFGAQQQQQQQQQQQDRAPVGDDGYTEAERQAMEMNLDI